MKVRLALCIIGSAIGGACAAATVEPRQCLATCTQEMKACYRINDVIFIDHCDQEYKRCRAACSPRRLGDTK